MGTSTADAKSDKPPFTIVIPPPNVTGRLHLGHAFEHTLQDALIRRQRMQGYEALWLPGMDHAGIATQNVVERELAKQRARAGTTSAARRSSSGCGSGRTSPAARSSVRCGGSATASTGRRERFTMDEGLSRAVQTIFKRLYDDGLIYRAERIINWCPRCRTALSDIEVEHHDDDGELVSIRYGDGQATPSSSRPPAPRRCSATPPSRCTRTTSATRHLVGTDGRAAADRPAHPDRRRRATSTRRSAPAR